MSDIKSDTIKRSDAIKAMEQRYQDILRIFKRKVKDGEKAIALDMIGCIKSVPSADRPQGEWIRISSLYSLDRTYRCSVCGKVIDDMPMDEYYDPAYKGCPYCFTRMKGADDE